MATQRKSAARKKVTRRRGAQPKRKAGRSRKTSQNTRRVSTSRTQVDVFSAPTENARHNEGREGSRTNG
jgi:hypothetical protein